MHMLKRMRYKPGLKVGISVTPVPRYITIRLNDDTTPCRMWLVSLKAGGGIFRTRGGGEI